MAQQKPKILSQGAFDGACLLYAIMNAYKSFRKKTLSSSIYVEEENETWEKLVKLVPSPLPMLKGKGSSSCFGRNEIRGIDDFVEKAIRLLNRVEKFRVGKRKTTRAFRNLHKFRVEKKSIDCLINTKKTDFVKSIAIFCYTKKGKIRSSLNNTEISDHWVCAIGREDRSINVQCSFTSQLSTVYREQKDETTGRYYNQKISVAQLNPVKIEEDYIYWISINH
jgi:hypothetical protein